MDGLLAAYNLGPDLSAALSVLGISLTGDPIGMKWSIGGPFTPVLGGLLSKPSGISYSHNRYEGDGSATRVNISFAWLTSNVRLTKYSKMHI